jgi:serine/threonine-protein kinase
MSGGTTRETGLETPRGPSAGTTLADRLRWTEVELRFTAALDRPRDDRARWVRERIADDAVRSEVEAMLAAHDRMTGVLDRAPAVPGADIRPHVERALGDRYTVIRLLGRGGSATVFLAREHKHDREVVLKVLHPEVAADVGLARFVGEVRIAAQLSHPHILPLIDSGEVDGLLYYVMPRLEGETLRARLESRGPLATRESVELLRDIAEALAAAHAQGIVHRDLKPENVLCAGSHAYLLDFGIARREAAGDARHTREGAVVGTIGYMSPEQSAGIAVDARSDLFAWGVMAREMLSGAPPLEAAGELRDVPAPLASLVTQALEQDPERRPASAQEILSRLDAVRSAPRRGRRRIEYAALATIGVALLVAALTMNGSARAGGLPQPMAVAPLRNETGDTSLAIWGRLAADWFTQGLHETALVQAVPWPSVRQVAEDLLAAGRDPTPVALAGEVNAGTIVSGSYYLAAERIGFRLDVTDARGNRLLASLPAIVVPRDSLERAVAEARDRLMGFVALTLDERAAALPGIATRPPTFDAYRAFDRGLALYNSQDYAAAAAEFRHAWSADTSFPAPLIYAAMAHWNRGELAWVDTLLAMARAERARLSEYDRLQVEYLAALLASDGERAVAAGRRAVAIAPESRAAYNLGRDLVAMDRAAEGRQVLEAIHPDRGLMKGWPSYWTQLTHARHLLGAHELELDAARQMRQRFPDARVAWVLEARALAALGRSGSIDSLLALTGALPAGTYWSHAAAMVVAGEELYVHQDSVAGRRYLERAVAWLEREMRGDPRREHRYWLGSALYDLARWQEAAGVFQALHRDFPDRLTYRGLDALGRARLGDHSAAARVLGPPPAAARGEHTTYLARLAAVAGDTAAARVLRARALGEVSDGYAWLHASAFRDFAP